MLLCKRVFCISSLELQFATLVSELLPLLCIFAGVSNPVGSGHLHTLPDSRVKPSWKLGPQALSAQLREAAKILGFVLFTSIFLGPSHTALTTRQATDRGRLSCSVYWAHGCGW